MGEGDLSGYPAGCTWRVKRRLWSPKSCLRLEAASSSPHCGHPSCVMEPGRGWHRPQGAREDLPTYGKVQLLHSCRTQSLTHWPVHLWLPGTV